MSRIIALILAIVLMAIVLMAIVLLSYLFGFALPRVKAWTAAAFVSFFASFLPLP